MGRAYCRGANLSLKERTGTPRTTPFITEGPYANVHHNLVHAVRGSDVTTTVVAGDVVVRDGRLCNADLSEIIDRAAATVPGLFARRREYLDRVGEPHGLFV